ARGIRSRDQVRSYLLERIEKEYPPEQMLAEEIALKTLGLLPDEIDLMEALVDLLTEQIAGYYDPFKKTFYIADWIPVGIQEAIMAHELTHALQDQHFDLTQFLSRVEDNDDETLARAAVVEGEGLAMMLEYTMRPRGQKFAEIPGLLELLRADLSRMNAQYPAFAEAPFYIRETLLFPYVYGAAFLQAYLKGRRWGEVDELYENLPRSSRQILHPEDFLETPHVPTPVRLDGFRSELDENWTSVYENTLGQFSTYLLLALHLDESVALTGSRGWDGDRYEVLTDSNGDRMLLWRTAWESERDAGEFQEAYANLLRNKHPGADEDLGEQSGRLRNAKVEAAVSRRGRWVEIRERHFRQASDPDGSGRFDSPEWAPALIPDPPAAPIRSLPARNGLTH
ncbi:MAG TPA: hypothetical protein VMN76_08855, partial [Acidobacteriota bacterium]|nr:hypothetical protein [Acidobacteriota bacterium]